MNIKTYDQEDKSSNALFISVAGNIGCGKTTLTKKLAHRLGWRPRFESVDDNPYLSDFYYDMKRWSFPLQVYFLNHRFKVHNEIQNSSISTVQDRSIYEDANIFCRVLLKQGNLSLREYETYHSMYDTLIRYLGAPTLIIFLKRSVEKLIDRIEKRDRLYEKEISVEYLTMLNHYYEEWFSSYCLGKKLIVDTDDLDFLNNGQDFDRLVGKIFDSIAQQDLFQSFH